MTLSRDFSDAYRQDAAENDIRFLEELRALAVRFPRTIPDVLATAFVQATDGDDRRVIAARLVAELAQALETYCVLVLAIRERAARPIMDTVVGYKTREVLDVMDQLPSVQLPKDFVALVGVPADRFDPNTLATLTQTTRNVNRALTLKDGFVRTFYNKTKHGAALLRSMPDAPEGESVFVVTTKRNSKTWDALGLQLFDNFAEVNREMCRWASLAIEDFIIWTNNALVERKL